MSQPDTSAGCDDAHDLVLAAATLQFENGQTTLHVVEDAERLAAALHCPARIFVGWDLLVLQPDAGTPGRDRLVAVRPLAVDMGRVAATLDALERFCRGALTVAALRARLDHIAHLPPVSLTRFAAMAAAGAAALGVIFGATNPVILLLIAASGGAGACLRRAVGRLSHNPFIQPFCAALLAGLIGAVASRFHLGALDFLVAECPCMILVPGPHLLNGTLDLARTRVTLGFSRVAYACLIILAICAGLLLGLALAGGSLPVGGKPPPVPLAYDVVAAGVAVAAYGTFFSLPWRALYIPAAIGMIAHAARWFVVVTLGANIEVGALIACLLAGSAAAVIADRRRLPFAGLAFASVVSLIPGVFVFRMAGGLVRMVGLAERTPLSLLTATIADGGTAFIVLMAMAFGLLVPRMIVERLR